MDEWMESEQRENLLRWLINNQDLKEHIQLIVLEEIQKHDALMIDYIRSRHG